MAYNPWLSLDVEAVKALRAAGKRVKQIALWLGRSPGSVRGLLDRERLTLTRLSIARILPHVAEPHDPATVAALCNLAKRQLSSYKSRLRKRGHQVAYAINCRSKR